MKRINVRKVEKWPRNRPTKVESYGPRKCLQISIFFENLIREAIELIMCVPREGALRLETFSGVIC